jgi:hypothetical protein
MGQIARSDIVPHPLELIVMDGIECVQRLGWTNDNSDSVPRTNSPAVQREVGRCIGIFDAAVYSLEDYLGEVLYGYQLGVYVVTLRPTLIAYGNCLAEDCDQLEEIIARDIRGMAYDVYHVNITNRRDGLEGLKGQPHGCCPGDYSGPCCGFWYD